MLTAAERFLFLRDLNYLKKLLHKTPTYKTTTKKDIHEQIILIESVVRNQTQY